MKRFAFLLASLLLPAAAFAADPAPPVQDSMAPPTCKKPVMISSIRKADDNNEFNEKVDAYQECIKHYMDVQNELAKKHVEAANAAADEANAFRDKVNESLNNR